MVGYIITLSIKKLCKKLGVRPNFGDVRTSWPPPVVAPMVMVATAQKKNSLEGDGVGHNYNFSLFHCKLWAIIGVRICNLQSVNILFSGKSTKFTAIWAGLFTPICTKSFAGWVSLQRSPDPYRWGLHLKGKTGGREGRWEEGRSGKGVRCLP